MGFARRLAATLCAVALTAGFVLIVCTRHPNSQPTIAGQAALQRVAGSKPRKIYPYSVIPGGAYSDDELAVAKRVDAVVANHYRDFKPSGSVRVLPKDMLMYVSYRKSNRVYWTKTKRRIPKGELVLSDGNNLARARCGNRLSLKPQAPMIPGKEPGEDALNTPEAPGVPLIAANEMPAAPNVDFFVPAPGFEAAPVAPRFVQGSSAAGGGPESPYGFGSPHTIGPFLGNSLFYPGSSTSGGGGTVNSAPTSLAEIPEPRTTTLLTLGLGFAAFLGVRFGMRSSRKG